MQSKGCCDFDWGEVVT
ncbi:hypothetical protein A2U01_0073611, partial [Trifolium medium]|nr:hypothetical protein [Trifolium medium]